MKFSIRTLLITLNLFVLLLPLAGIQILRIYESALVRQTESTLIAQSAFIASFFRSLVKTEAELDWRDYSSPLPEDYQRPASTPWIPRPATLDLADSEIHEPFPEPTETLRRATGLSAVTRKLNPTLKDAQLTTLAGIRVVDIHGTIIASTGTDLGLSIQHGPEIQTALRGESASSLRSKSDIVETAALDSLSRTSGIRVFVASPIMLEDRLVGAVLLSRTPPSIVQALYGKRWLLAQSLALVIALAIIMSLFAHRFITRPIKRIVATAEEISEGRTQSRQRITRRKPVITELARLQQAIANMATTLEARAEYLRDFVRHISHEFKTPLAGIRGATELIEEHRDMSEAQLRRFLDNISADTDRLQALTERLNQLTEAELQSTDGATARLSEILSQLKISFPDLTIEIVMKDDREVDQSHTSSALEILINNALQHGAKSILFESDDSQLSIRNDGAPISQGNTDKLFTPFFTTRREQGGTGLGLSIARTLLNKTGADLQLKNADPVEFSILWSPDQPQNAPPA